MKKRSDVIIVISYFVFNLVNTLFLTSTKFNRYIVCFDTTFSSLISSFIGNLVVLLLLFLIGLIIFKKPKALCLYLTIVTGVLNILIIALGYYTKSYKMAFSIYNFNIFKNPTGGFGANVFFDWIYELFGYFRIVSLVPFIFMLVLFLVSKKYIPSEKIKLSLNKVICSFAVILSLQSVSFANYSTSLAKNWKYASDYAQYGCQYAGVYNYYFTEILLGVDNRTLIEEEISLEEAYLDLEEYNKNKIEYTNFIDGKTYSNMDNQTGILKDKNIFVIQMESTMSFCYENEYKGVEITPYFNELFKDNNCFYFNNVFTNIGMGNTSDAEFTFFTGYYPTGEMTIVWEYDEYDFYIPSLGEYLSDYSKYSYNPTTEVFYNHNVAHVDWFKMDKFRGLETFESIYPRSDNIKRYLDYWIRDNEILYWATKYAKNDIGNGINNFSFVETITPHNPFPDFGDKYTDYEKTDFDLGILNYQLENYVNQVKYNDKMLYDFLMDVSNPSSDNYLKDTVFILYGDHGNALSKDRYEALYERELSDLEYRRLSLNIPFIVYDPTNTIYNSIDKSKIDSILNQVKSERDIHRTLVNLLGIETSNYLFGVNMFSGEPSFNYDPKNYDIIFDDFMYSKKESEYVVYNNDIDMNLVDIVSEYRIKQDLYINTMVYTSKKREKI